MIEVIEAKLGYHDGCGGTVILRGSVVMCLLCKTYILLSQKSNLYDTMPTLSDRSTPSRPRHEGEMEIDDSQ